MRHQETRVIKMKKKKEIVRFSNVSKIFLPKSLAILRAKPITALDRVSFSLYENQVYALVGSSGSGKSTLCRLLLGLIYPDGGGIEVFGQPLPEVLKQNEQWYRKQCQAIFQDPTASLSPRKKVRELLEEPLMLTEEKLEHWEKEEIIAAFLQRVGLPENFLDRYPYQLSGGEAQRVCIARALIRLPQLLICDEPTSKLDISREQEIVDLIVELKNSIGLTILFVTHKISLVRQMADVIGILSKGRLITVAMQDLENSLSADRAFSNLPRQAVAL
jgi:peptide/nickel transport system ATP-binding protein